MENHIAANADLVKKSNTKVKIEGNCDEFGTDEYNYALGLKRAKAVKDSIAAQGVDASKMVIISFGESNPVCSNPTDECYAQNRRVDLRLVK
jgi:peptidoglycan-associated lipoprotein